MLRKILSTALILIFSCCFARPAEKSDTYADLLKTYNIDDVRSDFIIMIDQSASMSRYWPGVRDALLEFIMSLPDGDYVSIWGFDSAPRQLTIPRFINNNTRKNLASELAAVPNPSGSNTDLFRAVDRALEELNRRSKNDLKFVFFFTDFVNSPPSGSDWQESVAHLNSKYKALFVDAGKVLSVHAIQLPLSPKAGRDFNAFAGVFEKNVIRFMFDVNSLSDWFMDKKDDMERVKLTLALNENFDNAFKVENISIEDEAFVLKLSNSLKLPAKVLSASVRVIDYGNSMVEPDGKMVKPGESFELSIPFNDYIKDYLKSFFSSRQSIFVKNVTIGFIPDYSEQLKLLDIAIPVSCEVKYTGELTFTTGVSPYYLLIPVIIIAIIAFLYIRKKRQPVPVPEPEPEPERFTSKKYRVTVKLNNEIQSLKKDIFELDEKVFIGRESLRDDNPKMTDFALYINPASGASSEKQGNGLYISYEAHPSFTATYSRNGEPVKEPMIRGKNILAEEVFFDSEYKMAATYMNKFRNDNNLEITIGLME